MFRHLLAIVATVLGQDLIGSTGCTASSCVFANQNLRFGTGAENSINAWGLFQQPWYFSHISNTWYKLTFNNYPLDTAIGMGNNSATWSGVQVTDLYSLTSSNSFMDYSNFTVNSSDTTKTVGYGVIVSRRSFTISGQQLVLKNTFSLGLNDSFVKVTVQVINNSTAPIQNVIIWTGTRDDFVGGTDANIKTRGNLNTGSFVAVTSNTQPSRAIMITNPTEGVLFYSETEGVMTAYSSCCSFANVYNTNPLSLAPSTPTPTDGSYAAVLPIGTLAPNASGTIVWYYAAGAISSLSTVAQSVAVDQITSGGGVVSISSTPSLSSSTTQTPTPSKTASRTVTPSPTPSSTQTLSATPSSTQTLSASPSQTPSSTSSFALRFIIAHEQPTIFNITTFFSSTIIENFKSDNSIFVYVFVPLNVILIFCCFLGGAIALWRRSPLPVRTAWANPMVEQGAQAPRVASPSVRAPVATPSVRISVPAPAVQIRIPQDKAPTAFTAVARPK